MRIEFIGEDGWDNLRRVLILQLESVKTEEQMSKLIISILASLSDNLIDADMKHFLATGRHLSKDDLKKMEVQE